MEAHKIVIKFFAQDDSQVESSELIPIFHSWIQTHAVPEHLLIDVADYAHVHSGPGTVLVAHEANFYADKTGGRFGFIYSRKQPYPGSFADRLRQAVTAALEGCARFEEDARLAGRLRFRTDQWTVKLNDRLLAPNNAKTLSDVRPEVEKLARELYSNANITLDHEASPQLLFELRVNASQSPDVTTLLTRLGRSSAPAR